MNHTPAMQQYYDLKEKYPDAILFFRMGDFYEMFGEDAVIANKILSISLTTRNKNANNPIPLAGIPYHAKDKYLGNLIDAGYKVAIAEQVSDPSTKGIVEREVVRVVTPSTITLESDAYSGNHSQKLLSIFIGEKKYAMACFDLAKFSIETKEFSKTEEIVELLYNYAPLEVIVASQQEKKSLEDTILLLKKQKKISIFYHNPVKNPEKKLLEHFQISNLSSYNIADKQESIKAIAVGIDYLEQHQKQNIQFFQKLEYVQNKKYLTLDSATIRSLDLVFNSVIGSANEGTLISVLDYTFSSLGKRKLYHEILHPLQNIETITFRKKCIEELIENIIVFDKIQNELKNIYDIDAILGRIAVGRASIKDINNLKKSLKSLEKIKTIIQNSDVTNLKLLTSN